MDGNTTATCAPAALEASYMAMAQQLRPAYVYLMVPTVLTSLLLPFLGALFYFSTLRQRQNFMFLWVVLTVVSAMVANIFQVFQEIKVLQNPFRRPLIWNPAAVATMGVLDGLPNFFADLALLCRMLVVYPYSMTSHPRYFAIFVPVICIKIIRIVSMIVTVSLALHHPAHVGSFAWTNTNRIWAIVNITAAAVDNGYVSVFFLWKLRGMVVFRKNLELSTPSANKTTTSRIRTLLWLAMSSFIIPVPLLCVTVVLVARTLKQSVAIAIVQYLNIFLSAVCVAFATVWASRHHGSDESVAEGTTFRFRSATPSYLRSSLDAEDNSNADEIPMKKTHSPEQRREDWKGLSV